MVEQDRALLEKAQRLPPSALADRFIVRLPDGMRETIKEIAKREGRSMNTQIVRFIEIGLRLDGRS